MFLYIFFLHKQSKNKKYIICGKSKMPPILCDVDCAKIEVYFKKHETKDRERKNKTRI